MMIGIVGLTISCMKGRETYIRFKAKYNKKETLCSITLLGEETSILAVDSEEEDEEEEWVEAEDRSTEKTQMFDAKKERQMFEEARKEFRGDQGSSSKTRPEVREYGMPLEFDQSASPKEGKEVRKLMEFLYTCIKLIQDESVVQELQNLIRQYELGKIDPLLNRAVHQIGKKRRTNKELHLNAQIGEYEIDYVVLDLGSEVNVMTKKTWALMGKPKLIYSPIRLKMSNQQAVEISLIRMIKIFAANLIHWGFLDAF
jgi:hypothetical protein